MVPKPSSRRRKTAATRKRRGRPLTSNAPRTPRSTANLPDALDDPDALGAPDAPDAPDALDALDDPNTPIPPFDAAASAAENTSPDTVSSLPTLRRRRYVPGGAGGGGRFVEEEVSAGAGAGAGALATPATTRPPPPATSQRTNTQTPATYPRRKKSTRIRNPTERAAAERMPFSSAAAVAAAVVQSEGYKPREERGWEEFHPDLDIDAKLKAFRSELIDGTARPITPADAVAPANGSSTPIKDPHPASTGNTPSRILDPAADAIAIAIANANANANANPTPTRRRPVRPTRDYVSLFATRLVESAKPPPPKVLPIHNQTPKERLDLKLPSYCKTTRVMHFESKTFGQARYVDKAMSNVGYQESDNYIRPETTLIKAAEINSEEDGDQLLLSSLLQDEQAQHHHNQALGGGAALGQVEYDMDEQDDMWLEALNKLRREHGLEPVTRELFEITITKIEKQWHVLEKRIPKPNPRPPQTHRPRSGSAAAVSGEPQVGEEQDTKCAICDDGDCENSNAIVFCDGCDLAVHQECYGVPFIPEGQWHCRKCQLIGRGIPTCIFCPNTDGAFKQTNSSKWAHLLCAMWIPEASLGNHTFMEPVMDVEKVPKTRWKLTCYICNQKMGACIQCGNKACYQAFHVTCARRARLFLKMKTSQGSLAVLDGGMVLKAFCDKHCPPDHTAENAVEDATKAAQRHYRKTMKGRIWADSQAAASAIAATHRAAATEHSLRESQATGAKDPAAAAALVDKRGQPGKPIWRLPSGAPVIPHALFETVESSLQRFGLRKRKEYVADACRYWTLKRESRRGAALLKRLQLQMDTFSSMELTRRDFASMGPGGRPRLARRIEFARNLMKDLERLKNLSEALVQREHQKLEAAEVEQDFVDICYFPIAKQLLPAIEKAIALDKNVFTPALEKIRSSLRSRGYPTTLPLAHDLCKAVHETINTEPPAEPPSPRISMPATSPTKTNFSDVKDRRKLGKRILKAAQQFLETALQLEADITQKPLEAMLTELDGMVDAALEIQRPSIAVSRSNGNGDVDMTDAPVAADSSGHDGDAMDTTEDDGVAIEHRTMPKLANGLHSAASSVVGMIKPSIEISNGYDTDSAAALPAPPTPPWSNGSLGKESVNPLSEGGIPWYLNKFEPRGTTVIDADWMDREQSLSEELTDIDDDEFKGLAREIAGEAMTPSVTEPEQPEEPEPAVIPKPRNTRSSKKQTRTSARRR